MNISMLDLDGLTPAEIQERFVVRDTQNPDRVLNVFDYLPLRRRMSATDMSESGSESDSDFAQLSPRLPASSPLPLPDFPLYSSSPIPQDLPFTSPGRMARPNNTGFIDLTADTSPPATSALPPMLRPPSPHRDAPAIKRRRVNNGASATPTNLQQSPLRPIAEIMDLTKVDDDAGLHKLQEEQRIRHDQQLQRQQEQQQAESIRALHEQSRKPIRISDLQCVVCMENMTDITATHCGKLIPEPLACIMLTALQDISFATLVSWKHS